MGRPHWLNTPARVKTPPSHERNLELSRWVHSYTAHGHPRGSGDLGVPSDKLGRDVSPGPVRQRQERHDMTTTPQEPGSDPDVTPGGDPLEPNPPSPSEPDETEHPD